MPKFDKLNPLNALFARKDFFDLVSAGLVEGMEIIKKFGRTTVTATLSPIALGGKYQTPLATQALEVVSASADDTALGTGARNCIIQGLDDNWNEIETEVAMNGLTPVPIPGLFRRVYRVKSTLSGTYAYDGSSSQAGIITVRDVGGAGETWAILAIASGVGLCQSQIGAYSVPKGKAAFLKSKFVSIDTGQDSDIYFFQRPNIDVVVAPFSALRMLQLEVGMDKPYDYVPVMAMAFFDQLTDIGFMAVQAAATAQVSVDFELLVVDRALYGIT